MISGEQALNIIIDLSRSQGCWGRLLRDLEENNSIEDFKKWVEEQQFTDTLDLILCLEGN
jgi:hypothetical protein